MHKVLSLFSGIAGLCELGIAAAGLQEQFQVTQFVENNEYCQKVLSKRFPAIPIWGDIRTFSPQPGEFDVFCGGFPCFVAGTQILTIDGYKPIETVQVGELVLTHTGEWQKVTQVMVRENAPLREIKAVGVHSLMTTDEHPFYVIKRTRQWENKDRKYKYGFTNPEWTDAINLTSQHYLSQVLPPNVEDDHPEAFWKLVGLYLADGWRVKRLDRPDGSGRVVICANKEQLEQVSQIIQNAGFRASICDERTVAKFHIVSNLLYQFLEQFGYKAEGKKIPGWVLGLEQSKAKALFEGIVFGDGWINSSGYYRVTTVSSALAYSIALLAQKAYGCIASVFYALVPETTVIEGRRVNQKPQYSVQVTFNNQEKKAFVNDLYGWKRIRQNKKISTTGTVYNLTVATDNSYLANGAIVHNCQNISSAGKREGIRGGFSGLFFEIIRLVCVVRPRYLLLENVANLLANGMGEVLAELSECGYDAEWSLVSAAEVGAVHKRERIFIIAYAQSERSDEQGRQSHPFGDKRGARMATGECDRGDRNRSVFLPPNSKSARRNPSGCDCAQRRTDIASISCGNDVTHTDSTGLEAWQRESSRQGALGEFERSHCSNNGQAQTQPRLCRENARLPGKLDGNLMTHEDLPEWLPLATDSNTIPYRKERLMALGNAVCPQQGAIAWKRLAQIAGAT